MVDVLSVTLVAFNKYLSIFPYIVIAYLLICFLRKINLKDKIKKIGKKHRVLAAYLLGVLSHGNVYMWYPILKELEFKEEEIAIVLYNRAIKIPQIPIQVALFGWKFAIILNAFVLLSSIPYGLCTKAIIKYLEQKSR